MPEIPDDACPPDAENNTAEAPAPRPAPLQSSDKSDVGCMIMLGAVFLGVFLLVPAIWFGAVFVIAGVGVLLLAVATPFLNPMERRSTAAKWWGRIIIFLILAGLVAAVCFWLNKSTNRMVEDDEFSCGGTVRLQTA